MDKLEDVKRGSDIYTHRNFLNFLLDSKIKKIDNKMTLALRDIYKSPKLCLEHKIIMPIDEHFEATKLDSEAKYGTITINEHWKDRGRDAIPGGDVLINAGNGTNFPDKPKDAEVKA